MTALTLRWRVPERRIVTRWRGPAGMAQALLRTPELPLAAIVGPPGLPGPQGPAGNPQRIDATLAATWVLPHALGRVPAVQVYLTSGEAVIADVVASATTITVVHAVARAGFVLIA